MSPCKSLLWLAVRKGRINHSIIQPETYKGFTTLQILCCAAAKHAEMSEFWPLLFTAEFRLNREAGSVLDSGTGTTGLTNSADTSE